MASALRTVLYALQTAFGAYNLYLASISVSNLQKYEEASKKAAEYSNIAESQLHKTRTTQATLVIAMLTSTLFSTSMTFASSYKLGESLIAVLNVAVLVVVRNHVGGFWKGKAKVPLPKMGEYNEAISKTQEVRLNMAYLAASWVVSGALALIF